MLDRVSYLFVGFIVFRSFATIAIAFPRALLRTLDTASLEQSRCESAHRQGAIFLVRCAEVQGFTRLDPTQW